MAAQPLSESARLAAVQAPVIPVIAELIARNPGVISLGQGVVHYGPPPEVRAGIEEFWTSPDNHKYKPVTGLPALIDAFQKKLSEENGFHAPSESLIVTAGSNMGFLNALLAICDPGDEVILPTPCYFNHEMAITMANCKAVLVETEAGYQLNIEQIEKGITPRTKAIVTISPNNPTGAVYPEASLRAVNELCAKRGLFHISDDAYEYFVHDNVKHFSARSIEGSGERTIALYSLSKSYGFASWRIGCMVVPPQLIAAVKKVQDTNLICASVIAQYAALGALKAGRSYCEPLIREMGRVRDRVWDAVTACRGVLPGVKPQGGFYVLMKCETQKSSMQLARELIEQHGVATIPGNAFGITDACALRIGYGALQGATVDEGVRRLVNGLKELL
ncbi:MAG TPA: pyridoxal phosphate-dependent aminotransferase [Methylomirabilota bacterium]|nr:pyridoxal phosphate-dependent aminotransferase [Methylomirabilota bacterium]